mmetsp:Transcript_18049/g.41988  ORF Transcript_18049/g.41988 Transcript_18049/m.41988 type:complete len:136 (+) Transcript_18049:961-1368(+)
MRSLARAPAGARSRLLPKFNTRTHTHITAPIGQSTAPKHPPPSYRSVGCTGAELKLSDCVLELNLNSNADTAVGTGSSGGDACGGGKDGEHVVGITCGPTAHSGPEVCFVGESGVRQCWNSGAPATMLCGTPRRN